MNLLLLLMLYFMAFVFGTFLLIQLGILIYRLKKNWNVDSKKVRSFNHIKRERRNFLEKLKTAWHETMNWNKLLLINMELVNGHHITFLVSDSDDGFKYRGKKYTFDPDSKYYNQSNKYYCYDYHELLSLPIKRNVPVNDIKTSMEESGLTEVEYAINPATLDRFITSKIAEGIMKGASFEDFLRKFIFLLIIITIIVAVNLILNIISSGAINNITKSLGV